MSEHAQRRPPPAALQRVRDRVPGVGGALLRWLALASVAALAGCAPQPQEPPQPTPPIVGTPSPGEPERAAPPATRRSGKPAAAGAWDIDLERDEGRGGHTIAKHVGRTDAQLQARLRRESIAAASTYPDLETAERVVQRTLDENARRVQVWIDRRVPKPNLAIRHRARDGLPTGRILGRGETRSKDAHGAVVVLRWRGRGWYVLTSYPESVR